MRESRHLRTGVAGTSVCLVILLLPAWAWAQPVALPLDDWAFWKFPGKLAIVGTTIMCVVHLMRLQLLGRVFEHIPRRWRIAVPVILTGVAGILWRVMNGEQSVHEAVYVGLFAGPTAVFAHEAVIEAILGRAVNRGDPEPGP
jgi:hypothetical protein